jgi:hypothetical protein
MRTRERVHGDIGRFAAKHPPDLRLLEVGDDINPGSHRHDRHQLGAGLHIEADPRGPVADRPIDRRSDHSVTKIEARLVENGTIVLQCRLRLGALRAQHLDLFFGGRQDGLIVFQRCNLVPQICSSLLGALNGTGTGLREGRIADIFLLCEGEIRVRCRYIGTGLFDRRLLLRNLRVETADIGLGGSYIGLRLIDRRLVVARVDTNQHFARLDPLIIGHQQFGDIAGDPWHDRGIVGLGISVISRFEPSPSGVPIPGETNGTD